MRTKEYELTIAVLRYAAFCKETGDWAALHELGFGQDETAALSNLKIGEISVLAQNLRGHVLDIRLDREQFWLTLREMRQELATAELKRELVCREAPAEMMQQLFGMSSRDYTAMRRKYRRPRSAGRPRDPDPETEDTIWRVWQQRGGQHCHSIPAQQWLEIADATAVDLRTLWRAICRNNELQCACG